MQKFDAGNNQIARNEIHTVLGFIVKEVNTLNEIKTRNKQEFMDVVKMEKIFRIGPLRISRRVYSLEYGAEGNDVTRKSLQMGFSTTK